MQTELTRARTNMKPSAPRMRANLASILLLLQSGAVFALPIASGAVDFVAGSPRFGARAGNCGFIALTTPTLAGQSASFASGVAPKVGFDTNVGSGRVFATSSATGTSLVAMGQVEASISPASAVEPNCQPWGLNVLFTSAVSSSSSPPAFARNTTQLVVAVQKNDPADNGLFGEGTMNIIMGDILLSGVGARSSFALEVFDQQQSVLHLELATPTKTGDALIVRQDLASTVTGGLGSIEFDDLTDIYTVHGGSFGYSATFLDPSVSRNSLVLRVTTQVALPEPSTVSLLAIVLVALAISRFHIRGTKLSSNAERIKFLRNLSPIGKLWMNGSTLRVMFLDGDADLKKRAAIRRRWTT